jgi:hypothetical protein
MIGIICFIFILFLLVGINGSKFIWKFAAQDKLELNGIRDRFIKWTGTPLDLSNDKVRVNLQIYKKFLSLLVKMEKELPQGSCSLFEIESLLMRIRQHALGHPEEISKEVLSSILKMIDNFEAKLNPLKYKKKLEGEDLRYLQQFVRSSHAALDVMRSWVVRDLTRGLAVVREKNLENEHHYQARMEEDYEVKSQLLRGKY